MEVKYLIADAVAPVSLSTKISTVRAEGSRLGITTQAELLDKLAKKKAFFLVGGQKSIARELAGVPGNLEFIASAGTLICDTFRESNTFSKDKTIVQVRGIYAFGFDHVADNSFHLAYKMNIPGVNTTSEIALWLLGGILKKHWGIT